MEHEKIISLVTGDCGFIGSHIVDRLLQEGHEVRVIDNCSTGRFVNLEHQTDNPNLTIYEKDIRDINDIEPVFQGVDYVFHLAALADRAVYPKTLGILTLIVLDLQKDITG